MMDSVGQCVVCGEQGRARCAQCGEVVYCGREHQVQHWREGHKQKCVPKQVSVTPAAAVEKGYALLEQGRAAEAADLLALGVAAYPRNLSLRVNYANCLADAGWSDAARHEYEACLERAPDAFEVHANFALFLHQSGESAAALGQFQRAIELNPDWFEGHYNMGNILSEIGPEKESDALAAYANALRIEPDEADAHTNYSLLLQRSGRLHDALHHAKRAAQLAKNDATAYLNLAGLLLLCGEMNDALRNAKEAARIAPHNHAAHATLAAMYELSDSPNLAITHHNSALALACKADCGVSSQMMLEYIMRAYALLVRLQQFEDARHLVDKYATAQLVQSLLDPRATEYPPAVRSLDDALLSLLKGDWAKAQEQLAGGDPTVDAVSQCSLAAMASLSIPYFDQLTHKVRLARYLQQANAAHWAPLSYIVRTAAQVEQIVNNANDYRVWYLKDPHMQRGQGVVVFETGNAQHWINVNRALEAANKEFVLQRAVCDLALIDQCKFGLRVHALVVARTKKWCVAVFRESVLTKCARPFSAAEVDPLVQITCTSVQRSLPGYDRSKVKGPGSVMFADKYDIVFPRIKQAVFESVRACTVNSYKANADADYPPPSTVTFQMFGYDFLVDSHLNPVVLEINESPQFGDPQTMPSLRSKMAVPMLNTFAEAIASMVRHESSTHVEADVRMPGWEGAGDFELDGGTRA